MAVVESVNGKQIKLMSESRYANCSAYSRRNLTGGTSIEDLAEKYPEKIIKIPIDVFEGITDAQAGQMVDGLKISGDKAAAAEQIKALYKCFTDLDCTMVEVCTPSVTPFVLHTV